MPSLVRPAFARDFCAQLFIVAEEEIALAFFLNLGLVGVIVWIYLLRKRTLKAARSNRCRSRSGKKRAFLR